MSRKLKRQNANPKISQKSLSEVEARCYAEQYPHVSFRYITTNSQYNFNYIEKLDADERDKAYHGLLFYLKELTDLPWTHWHGMRKEAGGIETLPAKQIRFSPSSGKIFSEDEKVIVLRFDTHLGRFKGRIIGFKDSPCSAFYVIGFDFDHSSYNHGS